MTSVIKLNPFFLLLGAFLNPANSKALLKLGIVKQQNSQ